MAKIRIKLRKIRVIKVGDGPFPNGVELFPCLHFNGSKDRSGKLGPKHEGLKNGDDLSTNDTWWEVDIPTSEFALLTTTYFEADQDHSGSDALKNTIPKPLSSYEVPEGVELGEAVNVIQSDASTTQSVKAVVEVLKAAVAAAKEIHSNNGDDFVGSWLTRVSVTPEGVFASSKGFGPDSVVEPNNIPITAETETNLPTFRYFIDKEAHVEYTVSAQVTG